MAEIKFQTVFRALREEMQRLKSEVSTIDKEISTANLKELNQRLTTLVSLNKKLDTGQKKRIQTQKEETKQREQLNLELQKTIAARQRQAREVKQLAKAEEVLENISKKQVKSLQDLQSRTNALVTKRRLLNTTTKQGRTAFKQLTKEILKNNNALAKADKSIGRFQRNVGNYKRALGGLGAAFGVSLGVVGLIRVFKNVGKIFQTFEKDAKRLQAIIGTGIDIKPLTQQAKDLGSSSVFTANQIVSLQTELAKLGFTVNEILSSTTGIQALAAATGIELAEAATIAGSALKIFGLDASEAGRVTDVLALSTSKSALDMEKLAIALPFVGTSAKIAGQSIEKTTAQLGILSDRGIRASTAGTSLRKIFAELSKKGLDFNESLEKINNSADKSKTAIEIFGIKAKDAAVILAENVDVTNELEEALLSADGAAQDMADTMLDNLAGDVTLAQSAWQGFVLSIEDGDGVISKAIRGIVQGFTLLLSKLTQLNRFGNAIFEIDARRAEANVNAWKKTIVFADESIKKRKAEGFLLKKQNDLLKLRKEIEDETFFLGRGTDRGNMLKRRIAIVRREIALVEELGRTGFFLGKVVDDNTDNTDDNTDAIDKNTKAVIKNNAAKSDIPEVLTGVATVSGGRGGDVESTLADAGQFTTDIAERMAFAVNKVADEQKKKGSFLGRLLGFGKSDDGKVIIQALVQLWGEAMNAISNLTQVELENIQNLLNIQDEAIAKTEDLLETEEERIRKLNDAGQAFSTKEKERLQEKLRNEEAARRKTLKEETALKKQQQRLAILQANVDIASAILRIWAGKGSWYIKLAQTIAFGLVGGLQLATISRQKFAGGTDSVSLNGAPEGVDTVSAMLTKGEGVIQESVNKNIPYHKGFKRSMMPAAAEMYLNGMRGNSVYVNDNEVGNGYLKNIEKNTRNDLVYDSMGNLKIKTVGKNKFYYN